MLLLFCSASLVGVDDSCMRLARDRFTGSGTVEAFGLLSRCTCVSSSLRSGRCKISEREEEEKTWISFVLRAHIIIRRLWSMIYTTNTMNISNLNHVLSSTRRSSPLVSLLTSRKLFFVSFLFWRIRAHLVRGASSAKKNLIKKCMSNFARDYFRTAMLLCAVIYAHDICTISGRTFCVCISRTQCSSSNNKENHKLAITTRNCFTCSRNQEPITFRSCSARKFMMTTTTTEAKCTHRRPHAIAADRRQLPSMNR